MGDQLAQTRDEGFSLVGRVTVAIGGGDVDIDVEPPGKMVGHLDVELGVGAAGDGGDDRGDLGGIKVKRGNDTH